MRALAALLLLLPAPFCAAGPSVFTPTSKAWVRAIHDATRPGRSQLTLHNHLPGLKESAPGVEMTLVLAPLAQELEAAGLEAASFASIDLETRDRAVLAAWDRAVQRVAQEGQPAIDKMYRPHTPDPDLPIDAAKLHELQAHLSGYLNRDDDLLRRAYKVARQRLAAMKTAEVQAAMARVAEALGRTPNEMAIHGADWLHAWSAEEAGVFPGNLDFWKTPDLKRDDFPEKVAGSDALIGNIPLPVHTPNRGGLSPYGARQLVVRVAATASPETLASIFAHHGLQITARNGDRVRVAIGSTASRERVAAHLGAHREVLSVVLPGKPAPEGRRLTIRFNSSHEGQAVSDADIEMILGLPELGLRALSVLPGRIYRVVVGKDAAFPFEEVAARLQRSPSVTYALAPSLKVPAEGQLIVRFKKAARDEHIGDVLGRLGLPVLAALGENVFKLGVPDLELLPDMLEALRDEPLIHSVTRPSET